MSGNVIGGNVIGGNVMREVHVSNQETPAYVNK